MFRDRFDAGKQLAAALSGYRGRKNDTVVLAIPRGALQIGQVLHEELDLPLDVIITKKIPHPANDEFAIGAVGPGGEYFVNDLASVEVPLPYIERKVKEIASAIDSRYKKYRAGAPPAKLEGKTVIVVDDGIATGSTMIAAMHFLRKQNPAKVVIAVPVAPPDVAERMRQEADEVVCLDTPELFFAIGQFYDSFPQVEDEEAIAILKKCRKDQG